MNLDKIESAWSAAEDIERISHTWQYYIAGLQIVADNFEKLKRKEISWYAYEEDLRTLEKLKQEHQKSAEYKNSVKAFDAYCAAIKKSGFY